MFDPGQSQQRTVVTPSHVNTQPIQAIIHNTLNVHCCTSNALRKINCFTRCVARIKSRGHQRAPKRGEKVSLTISQRRAIEDAARQRAKSMAATGAVLVDVEVVIGERAIGALTILPAVDVTIVARYRKGDVRGLSVEWPLTWHVSSIDFLTGPGELAQGP